MFADLIYCDSLPSRDPSISRDMVQDLQVRRRRCVPHLSTSHTPQPHTNRSSPCSPIQSPRNLRTQPTPPRPILPNPLLPPPPGSSPFLPPLPPLPSLRLLLHPLPPLHALPPPHPFTRHHPLHPPLVRKITMVHAQRDLSRPGLGLQLRMVPLGRQVGWG